MKDARILIAEADAAMARLMVRMLARAGFTTPPLVVHNPEDARFCASRSFPPGESFDAVVTELFFQRDDAGSASLELVRLCIERGISVVLVTSLVTEVPHWAHTAPGVMVVDKMELRALPTAVEIAISRGKVTA